MQLHALGQILRPSSSISAVHTAFARNGFQKLTVQAQASFPGLAAWIPTHDKVDLPRCDVLSHNSHCALTSADSASVASALAALLPLAHDQLCASCYSMNLGSAS